MDTTNTTTTNNKTNIIQFHGEEYDLGDLVIAGDIMMTRDQIEDEVPHNENEEEQVRGKRKRRNLVGPARPVIPWKDGVVPYIFNNGMSKFYPFSFFVATGCDKSSENTI